VICSRGRCFSGRAGPLRPVNIKTKRETQRRSLLCQRAHLHLPYAASRMAWPAHIYTTASTTPQPARTYTCLNDCITPAVHHIRAHINTCPTIPQPAQQSAHLHLPYSIVSLILHYSLTQQRVRTRHRHRLVLAQQRHSNGTAAA
jgi:hypothetical protein